MIVYLATQGRLVERFLEARGRELARCMTFVPYQQILRAREIPSGHYIPSKASVLAQIARKTRPGTQVIVREPFAAGILFAERGVDPRDRSFKPLALGPGDRRFLSRHVFLERTHEAAPAAGDCPPA